MTPADQLLAREARGRFASEVARPDEALDLARAALLLGCEEEPGRCDVEGGLRLLAEMGAEARARVAASAGSPVEALNRYLFEERAFKGNREDYYDPRNSMLHRVLERRTGIPITLSLVYMEVGRRAGLDAEGVGLPGHFIVRASEPAGRTALVDAFEGRVLDEEDCQQRLDTIYGGRRRLAPEDLRAVSARDILVRMLNNLKSIYVQGQLYRPALGVVERLLLLDADAHQERRDRGVLLTQLGRHREALNDLQLYLALQPDASDAEDVRQQLRKLQIRLAMLN